MDLMDKFEREIKEVAYVGCGHFHTRNEGKFDDLEMYAYEPRTMRAVLLSCVTGEIYIEELSCDEYTAHLINAGDGTGSTILIRLFNEADSNFEYEYIDR